MVKTITGTNQRAIGAINMRISSNNNSLFIFMFFLSHFFFALSIVNIRKNIATIIDLIKFSILKTGGVVHQNQK